jgi:hypothetical protein
MIPIENGNHLFYFSWMPRAIIVPYVLINNRITLWVADIQGGR